MEYRDDILLNIGQSLREFRATHKDRAGPGRRRSARLPTVAFLGGSFGLKYFSFNNL